MLNHHIHGHKKRYLCLKLSFFLCIVGSTALLSACSTPPKPQPLVELTQILSDPEIHQVKSTEGASKYVSEARQFEKLGEDAYKDGRLNEASDYGIIGRMRYQTAQALYSRVVLSKELQDLNSSLLKDNHELQTLSEKRNQLSSEVNRLKQDLIVAKNMANATSTTYQPTSSSENTSKVPQVSIEVRRQISALIVQAKEAEKKAAAVSADKFAPELYSRPLNQLKSIQTSLDNNFVVRSMVPQLEDIIKSFKAAYEKARPEFELQTERNNPALRRKKLRELLANRFHGDTTLIEIPSGVRVIFAGLYPTKRSELSLSAHKKIETIAKILKDFDDFEILIEGFTSSAGSTTESLSLSQVRAQGVAQVFEANGIKRSSIEWRGLGQTDYRFSPKKSNQNDRVEIILQRFQ